jgi:hypothetical protein
MMPQHNQTARICRDCDGFATVAITTGTHHPDGARATLIVACPTCKGTGHTTPAAGLTHAAR